MISKTIRYLATLATWGGLLSVSGHVWATTCTSFAIREPLVLTQALAVETLERLADEAESLYKGAQTERAANAFIELLEISPGNEVAWLRLGNLQQAKGCFDEALAMFGMLQSSDANQPLTDTQARAAMNIAIISAEKVQQQLAKLRKAKLPASLEHLRLQLEELYSAQQPPSMARQSEAKPLALSVQANLPVAASTPVLLADVIPVNASLPSWEQITRNKAASVPPVASPNLPIVQYIGGMEGKR